MSFRLKNKEQLFGVRQFVNGNIPVFNKKLDEGVIAEANRDNTIFVDEKAPDSFLNDNLLLSHNTTHRVIDTSIDL